MVVCHKEVSSLIMLAIDCGRSGILALRRDFLDRVQKPEVAQLHDGAAFVQ